MEKKYNGILIFLICLSLILLYYLTVYYPTLTNEFDFWHVATSIYLLKGGIIPKISPGFYNLNVIISQVTNIPLIRIPYLPLGLLTFIFLFFTILKKIDIKNRDLQIIALLLIAFITHFGNQSYIQWWTHGVGFLLILSSILLVFLRLKKASRQKEISLILIILIFSINYISYKTSFFLIAFILALIIIEIILSNRLKLKIQQKNNFIPLFIIGIIVVLSFNQVFFNEFLPRIRFISEMSSSGLDKLFFYASSKSKLLSEFYLNTPQVVQISNLIYTLLLLIPISLLSFFLIFKLYKKEEFIVSEKIFAAIMIASISSLIIYNRLGIFDMGYLLFAGFISYMLIFNIIQENNIQFFKYFKKNRLNYLIISLIFILISTNIIVNVSQVNNNYLVGYKDDSFGEYMNPATEWYNNNIINATFRGSNIATDVLTGGYFAKDIAERNKSEKYAPNVLDRQQLAFLVNIPFKNSSFVKRKPYYFIINYKPNHIIISNWETYKKWPKSQINNNNKINSIYSSGDIVIYYNN